MSLANDTLEYGATSTILTIWIYHSTTGAGLTALTSSSTGMILSLQAHNGAVTAYTVAASNVETITTLRTFAQPSSGKIRFKEIDATNKPGAYEVQIRDDIVPASPAKWLELAWTGATNMLGGSQRLQMIPTNWRALSVDSNGRLDVIKLAGTTQTARDLGASVLLSALESPVQHSGTAQAGASSTLTLAAGASATDNLYKGSIVKLYGGTGAGQTRVITGYVGSTKVATVGRAWATTPDNTSTYAVLAGSVPVVDDNLAVILQAGTGQGQVSLASGAVTVGTNTDKMGYSLATGSIAAATFAAGAIDANAIATDAIGSAELATTAVNEIRDAILSDSTPFAGARIDAAITSRLAPTTAGRTLDVAATGEAGLDFDNIRDATGAHTLTNIRVPNVTLTDTLTTYTGDTPQSGDSFARLGVNGAGLTALGDTRLANLDATVSSRSTYAGGDTTGTGTLLTRLTALRAGYLDNLNVGGNVASSAEVVAIQNNTRVVRVVPEVIERPDSGTTTYRVELLLYDDVGNMEVPDSAPTIALVNQAGTDRSSRLDATTMTLVSTGRYRAIYTADVGDALEQLVWSFSVVEGGATRIYGNSSLLVDITAVDFTSADRTKLDELFAKLPSKSFLAGSNNSDGDIQMDEATGNYPGSVGSLASAGLTALVSAVWAAATRVLTAGTNIVLAKGTGLTGLNDPSPADILDQTLSGHTTAGTVGGALQSASSAGDPWAIALPGSYASGQAGKIVGDNLNATVSSRLASASYTAPDNATIGTISTNVSTVLSRLGAFTGSGLNTVLGFFRALLRSDAGLTPTDVGGTFDNTTDSQEAAIDNAPAGGDTPGTTTLLTRMVGTLAAGTHQPQSGDAYARLGANGAGLTALATQASVDDVPTNAELTTALSGLSTVTQAQVKTQVVAALNSDTYTEPGAGDPPATASLVIKLGYMYATWRNKKRNNGSITTVLADDDSTALLRQTTDATAGTVTKGKWEAGA